MFDLPIEELSIDWKIICGLKNNLEIEEYLKILKIYLHFEVLFSSQSTNIIFLPFSSVSIVDFDQKNICWVEAILCGKPFVKDQGRISLTSKYWYCPTVFRGTSQ